MQEPLRSRCMGASADPFRRHRQVIALLDDPVVQALAGLGVGGESAAHSGGDPSEAQQSTGQQGAVPAGADYPLARPPYLAQRSRCV